MKFQILQILTTAMGVIMSLGYFPQAYKIYKTKSAESISIPSFIIFSVGTFVWTLYGFYLRDYPLVISFIIGVIGSWLILGLTIYYKKRSRDN
ncbi:MAG: SemiSWEET family transporter [Patescibacteria group bacterium]